MTNSAAGIANHIPSNPAIGGRMVKNRRVKIKTLKKDIIADLLPSPIDVKTFDVMIDIPQNKKEKENNLSPCVARGYTGLSGLQNKLVTIFDPKKEIANITAEKMNTSLKQIFIRLSVYSYCLAPHP